MRLIIIFLFVLAAAPCQAEPEIYINGIRYPSFDAYKATKNVVAGQPEAIVHPHAVVLQQSSVSSALDKISVERGLRRVMADFDQDWDNPAPKFAISTLDLEERIHTLVGDRTEPVLLIAEPNRLRVAVQDQGDR